MTILRDQVQRFLVAASARNHVVIVGLGGGNVLLAESFRRLGQRVVVVETDPRNARISGTRADGTRVIMGDGRRPAILRRAQIARARHVIIDSGDDSQNLEIAELVRKAITDGNARGPATVHVAIADLALWGELGRLQIGPRRDGVALEFYNLVDRSAQTLLNEAEDLAGRDLFGSVIVEGADALTERTLVHLVRRAALSGHRPRVYVSEHTAAHALAVALERGLGCCSPRTS